MVRRPLRCGSELVVDPSKRLQVRVGATERHPHLAHRYVHLGADLQQLEPNGVHCARAISVPANPSRRNPSINV